MADKVEQLMQELQTKEAEMKADLKEVDDLTHDLQKVRSALSASRRRGRGKLTLWTTEQLGAQIFNLEEEADQKDDRIRELETELDAVDTELEDKQTMHEQVVVALKEVSCWLQAGEERVNIADDDDADRSSPRPNRASATSTFSTNPL